MTLSERRMEPPTGIEPKTTPHETSMLATTPTGGSKYAEITIM